MEDECIFDQVEIYSIMFFDNEIWIGTVDGYLMLYGVINDERINHDMINLPNYNNHILLPDQNLINDYKVSNLSNAESAYKSSINSQSRLILKILI